MGLSVPRTGWLLTMVLLHATTPNRADAQWVPGLPADGTDDSQGEERDEPERPESPPPTRPPEPEPSPPEPSPPEEAAPEPTPRTAREFYERGREHFEAERYREAAADLERARQLDPGSANLVYNIARAYELAGDAPQALAYYHSYSALLAESDVRARAEAEARMHRLAQELAAGEAEPQAPPAPPAPEPAVDPEPLEEEATGSSRTDVWFWTAAAVSAAALVSATVVGVVALGQRSELDEYVVGPPNTCITSDRCDDSWDGRANSVRVLSITSDALFALSAATGATALLLFFLREEEVQEEEDVDAFEPFFALHPGSLMAGGQGRW